MEDSAIFEPDLVLAGPGSTVLGGFPEYGMAAIGLTGLDCPANSRSIQGYSGEYFPAIYGHKTASWCRTLQNTCLDISCSSILSITGPMHFYFWIIQDTCIPTWK